MSRRVVARVVRITVASLIIVMGVNFLDAQSRGLSSDAVATAQTKLQKLVLPGSQGPVSGPFKDSSQGLGAFAFYNSQVRQNTVIQRLTRRCGASSFRSESACPEHGHLRLESRTERLPRNGT